MSESRMNCVEIIDEGVVERIPTIRANYIPDGALFTCTVAKGGPRLLCWRIGDCIVQLAPGRPWQICYMAAGATPLIFRDVEYRTGDFRVHPPAPLPVTADE